uniref:N-acetyltransferase GCN5 n=1 Tax=Globodera pallida TaxID=36090 RepID=A0A183CF21_GLOPA
MLFKKVSNYDAIYVFFPHARNEVSPHFRPSALALLCAQSMPSGQLAKVCAHLTGIVLMPSGDGQTRPILIGPDGIGIGIGMQRKRHFWSARIAALEGRAQHRAGGAIAGTVKRAYDYIRFGRRSAAVHLAQQQKKNSEHSAGSTYDYIRFG